MADYCFIFITDKMPNIAKISCISIDAFNNHIIPDKNATY